MKRAAVVILMAATMYWSADAWGEEKIPAVVFNFTGGRYGAQLADSVRLGLRRHEYDVLDRISSEEIAEEGLGKETDQAKVVEMLKGRLKAKLGVYGTVDKSGDTITAEIVVVGLADPAKPSSWTKAFSGSGERARGVIAAQVVEAIRKQANWKPPEYGDDAAPTNFGKAINLNGDFETGHTGWQAPDRATTFIVDGPSGRGKVLKFVTDVERDKWLEYQRKLRFGQAKPEDAPALAKDTSYANSVAALEGAHYRSEWIQAPPGARYWMVADMKGKTAGIFFPKIFVKGYADFGDRADALPEQTLVEMKMTPQQFARLPVARQKQLIAADAARNPDRYRREVFRWYLACRNEEDTWQHYAAPCPPRGGLPATVKYLQIQVYAYWPPGTYLFDNVHLYADPNQKAPLDEEKARTPNFGRTSDVIEREARKKQ